MCINISEFKSDLSSILPTIQYYNAVSTIRQVIPSKRLVNSDGILESKHRTRINQYLQIDMQQNPNLEGYYDTLTNEDIVQKQYSLLPYPTVTPEELEEEKSHYNGTNVITKNIAT